MQSYQKDTDSIANAFTLKAVGFTCVLFCIIWILNALGIFIVDSSIMNTGFFGSILICVMTFGAYRIFGNNNPRTKYLVLLFSVINYVFICILLTYHAVLVMIIPILLSVQYRNKQVITYAYALTAVGQVISVFGGYYFGLCNANMLLFTSAPTQTYLQQIALGSLAPSDPGMPIPLALFIFFVVPQWFILLAILPVLVHISKQVEIRAQNELMGKRQSETDFMTGLSNKSHYEVLIRDHYSLVKNLAIIIWDINDLRQTNETRGHEAGDTLIAMAADAISPLQNSKQRAFRIGGDEFILIIESPSEGDINKALLKWNAKLDELNKFSTVKLRVTVGYSQGDGKDINFLIKDAYRMMSNVKETAKMRALPQ